MTHLPPYGGSLILMINVVIPLEQWVFLPLKKHRVIFNSRLNSFKCEFIEKKSSVKANSF